MMTRLGAALLLGVLLLLAGCEEAVTPFPANLPTTPTPTSLPSSLPPLRYGLDANTDGLIAEMDALEASAQVEALDAPVDPADLDARFDLIAAYGVADGWQLSPIRPQIGLLVNPSVLSPEIVALILSGVDGPVVADYLPFAGASALDTGETVSAAILREAFANLGLPDGLDAVLGAVMIPGGAVVQAQLAAFNVRVRVQTMTADSLRSALESGQISLALVSWTDEAGRAAWESVFGAAYLRPLVAVPIRYLAVDGVSVTFTPGGWPIATRTN